MPEDTILNPTSKRYDIFITPSDHYDKSIYPHCHLGYELSLILDGEHGLETKCWRCQMGSGHLALVRPMESHTRWLEQPGHFVNVEFPREEMLGVLDFLGNEDFRAAIHGEHPFTTALSPMETERLRQHIERLSLMQNIDNAAGILELRSILVELGVHIINGQITRNFSGTPWLMKLLSRMNSIENMQMGLPEMLKDVPYSHSYVCREFKRMIGTTPTEYLNAARMNQALKMLQDTNMDIVEIVYAVGFDSVSHFYHLFKKRFGDTPSRYRKRVATSRASQA